MVLEIHSFCPSEFWFFNYFKLSFAKEFILINSRSFDIIKSTKITVDENQIVLLDEQLNQYQWSRFRKLLDKKKITNTLTSTNFETLSRMEKIDGFHEAIISSKTKKK